jgi:hexosaminidase
MGDGSAILQGEVGDIPQVAPLRETLSVHATKTGKPFAFGENFRVALDLPARPLSAAASEAGFEDERHTISIGLDGIEIHAASRFGLARASATLRQIYDGPEEPAPEIQIEDEPAFSWRGMHLDCSRHFFPTADVKRFIDLLSYHKFSVFHWHLTDDQGWRLPVEGYPRLVEVAAWRDGTTTGNADNPDQTDGKRHGGYYSHEDIREIVAYAAARGIHVLPEIDLPGHVQALIAAYPEFGCEPGPVAVWDRWGISPYVINLNPVTLDFLECLLDTVAELFPFRYIHLGGDEVLTEQWEKSSIVRGQMQLLGIPSADRLQPWFTARLRNMVRERGRRLIGWDDLIEYENVDPDVAIMFWRDDPFFGGKYSPLKALRNGNPVVLANASRTYFNYHQVPPEFWHEEPNAAGAFITPEMVYHWNPLAEIPQEFTSLVLGIQGQAWTEFIPDRDNLDYKLFPRTCALAQLAWTGKLREPWDCFQARLNMHLSRLKKLGVNYHEMSASRTSVIE